MYIKLTHVAVYISHDVNINEISGTDHGMQVAGTCQVEYIPLDNILIR